MVAVRKSIDIPEIEFQKLQLLAISRNVSLKKLIEDIVIESVKAKPDVAKFVKEFNK